MDARIANSDSVQQCAAPFNAIHHVEDVSGSGTITEPVTLQQCKDYLRMESFDAGGNNDFTFDDTLIEQQITEGRMWVEKYTGIHVVQKDLQVIMTNQTGFSPIPGPVIGDIVMKDKDGNVLTTEEYIGSLFRKINTNQEQRVTLEYTAGYSTDVPDWVKNAILAYVAWAYEHRGDENGLPGSPVRAAAICRPHRRVQSWA